MGDIRALSLAAFGTFDTKHAEAVEKWFAHRRLQQLVKGEEHLKRGCFIVTLGLKGEVELLLRQARGCSGMNRQTTLANLKRLLTYLDISCVALRVNSCTGKITMLIPFHLA